MVAVMIAVGTQAATVSATVGVGSYPIALAVNAVTNKVYVANQNSNTVTVIDGASNTQQPYHWYAAISSGGERRDEPNLRCE